jgi:hypothetical protein
MFQAYFLSITFLPQHSAYVLNWGVHDKMHSVKPRALTTKLFPAGIDF